MKKSLISDILAGLTVSFAALSLGAAFGIMSGRGAFAGMIGAAVIPIITSLLGGTRIQASGPTAPMTAVTALLVGKAYDAFPGNAHLADEYITLVLFLSSAFIILAGIFRLGKLIHFVPQVVILGFMNGIAVLIWSDQIKKLFGWGGTSPLEGSTLTNTLIVAGSVGMIYLIPALLKWMRLPVNIRRFIPSIFVTIIVMTLISTWLQLPVQHVSLGDSYAGFSAFLKEILYDLPLDKEIFTAGMIKAAIPLALQLCALAYLDSLLTSLVIDKMTRETTKTNKELMAQGLANGISALLQGIPGAQATIRSVLLIKEGAQTRMAGVFVGLFALLGFLVFGQWIILITSAVFVGILLKAGLDVLDRDFPLAYFKYRWFKSRNRNLQFFIIILTTVLTVVVDLNIAVLAGTVLFYLGKKAMLLRDAESDFAEVHAEELEGQVIPQ
jgi:sulfate permease, SulP family